METIYSNVTFQKHKQTERGGPESPTASTAATEEVVYSTLACSRPAGPSPSNLPGAVNPADPSDGARSKVIANKSWAKDRLLLASLCALLFAVAIIGVLYALWQISHERVLRSLTDLRVNMTHLERENINLTGLLSERNRTIEQLQAEKENVTRELEALKGISVNCSKGWKLFSGRCYYFSADQKTWTRSRDACVMEGGDLVIINSEKEKNFLQKSKPDFGKLDYWIGLTDAVKEKDWRWLDGTKLNTSLISWTGKEPDNWTGTYSNKYLDGEDCAVMELESNWCGLRDAFCAEASRKFRYICEAEAGKYITERSCKHGSNEDCQELKM
ncbi:asialoglycoprotein receptor 1-like isoform X2 [Brachyhypopomus gauderio]|uniref:asialoglycoprotein receptor 1-like isoform X2 n=1 Tax=Brachyhypopomus gauderio TaxID=698409 RepID=UPI0040413114